MIIVNDLEKNLEIDRLAMQSLAGGCHGRKHYKGYKGYKGGKRGYRCAGYSYGYAHYHKEEYFGYGCYTPKYYCYTPKYFYGGYGC